MATPAAVDKMIETTIGKEGGFVDDPRDLGGATRWGVTEDVARKNGYRGPMRDLPRDVAKNIYLNEYFIRPGFDKIAKHSEKVAEELFDTGVNMGTVYPRLWLQQCLNAFNNQGKYYRDIVEDGSIGPGTEDAFRLFLRARGKEAESVMLKALNGLQCARYIELARARGPNEAFVFGWLANRVGF